jgi:hypothetical protein
MLKACLIHGVLAFASFPVLACSCVALAPMAGESESDSQLRAWVFKVKSPWVRNVFIGTVEENPGRTWSLTEGKGKWPMRLAKFEVLSGKAPADGLVQNNNACWAVAPVGARIVAYTDDSYSITMCNVDRLDTLPTAVLREIDRMKFSRIGPDENASR